MVNLRSYPRRQREVIFKINGPPNGRDCGCKVNKHILNMQSTVYRKKTKGLRFNKMSEGEGRQTTAMSKGENTKWRVRELEKITMGQNICQENRQRLLLPQTL